MHWWLDIEELDGTKAGPGPLHSAISFEVTRRLDAAGKFKAKAALDARASIVQPKRRARCWGLMNGTVTDLGAGIIDQIGVDTDLNMDLGGDDLLRELTYHQVGRLLIGASGAPSTTGPAQIAALFPTGWSLDVVNGYNATVKAIHHRFEGESCLAALCKLAEITGEHFRLGAGRTVIWMQNDRVASGVRAIQGGDPIALGSNLDVCVVTDLKEDQDSYDCLVGRVYAYGIGDGDARVNLSGATIGITGWTVGSDAKGYYLQHTVTWNAYGIERYMSFKDINDKDTLVETTYEWMVDRLALQRAYKVSIAKLERTIPVGSTIRVIYKRILDGVAVLDIDADLVVLETTTKLDADGLRTIALKVATVDVWPDNSGSTVSGSLNTSRDFYTHSQGFSSTTDTWSVIASAFGKIILLPAGGGNCTFYDPNQAGVDAALAAAVSYDGIYAPYPVEIAMTHGITIGASVRVKDLNLAFTCGGVAVTTNSYAEINHCSFVQDGSGEATAWCLDARDVRDTKIIGTYILAKNATQNIGSLLRGVVEDHGPEMKNSWTQALGGVDCVSLVMYDDSFAESTYAGGSGGSTSNIGVLFDSTQSGKRAGQFLNSWSVVTGTAAWAGTVVSNHYGRAIESYFEGATLGMNIQAGCTLYAGASTWNSITIAGTLSYLPSDRSPMNHTHIHMSAWYNVRDYGATGNGSTDDTTAVNTTLVAIEAAGGGVLYFPYGVYLTSGNFSLDVPITVRGDGSSSYFDEDVNSVTVTKIICNANHSLFVVNSWGCNFFDFTARCTYASPTTGAGIWVPQYGDLIQYRNLNIQSFSSNIYIEDGAGWIIDGCFIYEPVGYGIYFSHTDFSGDFGDFCISNTNIMPGDRNGFAAIYLSAGGGVKITNLKINGWYAAPPTGPAFQHGIYFYITGGISSGIVQISNSSIENCSASGFHLETNITGTNTWKYVIITGVEFGMYSTDPGTTPVPIEVIAGSIGDIEYLNIANCQFIGSYASAHYCIELDGVNHVQIANCMNLNFAGICSQIDSTDVVVLEETKLDDWGTPDDNTDLDATTGHHGLLPKLSGDNNEVLLGDGTWGASSLAVAEGCRVYNNANISTTSSSGLAITFNSEHYDDNTIHSTSSNQSRLTCQTAGKYHIFANIRWASNATGYRNVYLQVTSGGNTYYIAADCVAAVNGHETDQCLSTIWDLAAGDYVELWVLQTSGGNLNIVGGTNGLSPEFGMQRVG